MRQRLSEYAIEREVDEIIDRLLALKLLDDLNFSTGFASYKLRELNQGPMRIRSELLQRGVDEKTVALALESATAECSIEEAACKAAEKLLRKKAGRLTPREFKRILARLARAGFPAETIRKALRNLGADDLDWSAD